MFKVACVFFMNYDFLKKTMKRYARGKK